MRFFEWFFKDQGWIAAVAIPLGILGILFAVASLFVMAYNAGAANG